MGKNKKKQQSLAIMDGMDMMEPKMDDMMMDEEKPLVPSVGFGGGEDSDDEYSSVKQREELTACCCCMCVCQTDITKELTCCCCCPIKFGVQFIGSLTMLLTFYYISWNFFLILNDQVQWFPSRDHRPPRPTLHCLRFLRQLVHQGRHEEQKEV